MKTQAIIPLFIPHMGCQHECVFCNQNTITASDAQMDSVKVIDMMESKLRNLEPLGLRILEAAFYGGTALRIFYGLPSCPANGIARSCASVQTSRKN